MFPPVSISLFLWTNALKILQHETLFADVEFMQKRVLISSFGVVNLCFSCLFFIYHSQHIKFLKQIKEEDAVSIFC